MATDIDLLHVFVTRLFFNGELAVTPILADWLEEFSEKIKEYSTTEEIRTFLGLLATHRGGDSSQALWRTLLFGTVHMAILPHEMHSFQSRILGIVRDILGSIYATTEFSLYDPEEIVDFNLTEELAWRYQSEDEVAVIELPVEEADDSELLLALRTCLTQQDQIFWELLGTPPEDIFK